jgi:hypothetical protein
MMHNILCFDQKKIPPMGLKTVSHRIFEGSTAKIFSTRKKAGADDQN